MQHDLFIAASFVQLLHSSCKLVNLDELSKHVLMPEPKYWPSTFSRSDIASSKNSEREYSKLMQALDYVSGLHTVSNSRNSPPVQMRLSKRSQSVPSRSFLGVNCQRGVVELLSLIENKGKQPNCFNVAFEQLRHKAQFFVFLSIKLEIIFSFKSSRRKNCVPANRKRQLNNQIRGLPIEQSPWLARLVRNLFASQMYVIMILLLLNSRFSKIYVNLIDFQSLSCIHRYVESKYIFVNLSY